MKITGGEVLFASHTLEGTYFEDALILLLDNNADGVFGVILNRPSTMPLSEVFNIDMDLPISKRQFYSGGPMDEDMLLTLAIHDSPGSRRDGTMVSPFVELGGHWENVKEMLMADEESVRLFLGYAGWQEKQLDDELSEGSWEIFRGIDTAKLLQDWQTPPVSSRREITVYLKKNAG